MFKILNSRIFGIFQKAIAKIYCFSNLVLVCIYNWSGIEPSAQKLWFLNGSPNSFGYSISLRLTSDTQATMKAVFLERGFSMNLDLRHKCSCVFIYIIIGAWICSKHASCFNKKRAYKKKRTNRFVNMFMVFYTYSIDVFEVVDRLQLDMSSWLTIIWGMISLSFFNVCILHFIFIGLNFYRSLDSFKKVIQFFRDKTTCCIKG